MRRRFIQLPNGQLREVTLDWRPEPSGGPLIMSDGWLAGTVSPIDGSDIGSRTKRREHMRIHNVVDYDEIAPDIARWRNERITEFERSRKSDLVDAVHRLQAGYRPPRRSG